MKPRVCCSEGQFHILVPRLLHFLESLCHLTAFPLLDLGNSLSQCGDFSFLGMLWMRLRCSAHHHLPQIPGELSWGGFTPSWVKALSWAVPFWIRSSNSLAAIPNSPLFLFSTFVQANHHRGGGTESQRAECDVHWDQCEDWLQCETGTCRLCSRAGICACLLQGELCDPAGISLCLMPAPEMFLGLCSASSFPVESMFPCQS